MDLSGLACPVTKAALAIISSAKLSAVDGEIGYPIPGTEEARVAPEKAKLLEFTLRCGVGEERITIRNSR